MHEKVLDLLRKYNDSFDFDLIEAALEISSFSTDDHLRRMEILLPLGPGQESLLAFLMMDAFCEDKISHDEVKKKFGDDVCNILCGLKKLKTVSYVSQGKSGQIETLRKMFLAMAKDLRVMVIALIDKLFVMQYLFDDYEEEDKKVFAKEVLDLYVPIAERLGIYRLKTKIQDLAFCFTNPKEYLEIESQLMDIRKSCRVSIALIKETLEKFFESKGITAEISGRMKNVYSIYRKLRRKGLSEVSDLFDIFAMRVVLPTQDSVDHLYGVLGMIHSEWKPLSKRFKDYVAVPKANGYRSLHTVVLGLAPRDQAQPIEIQIRDQEMHRDSEYGVAAHWLYKDARGGSEKEIQARVDWILTLEKIREDLESDDDVLREVEVNIFKDRIFVLTPHGEVKDLPAGSIPLDFAYSIHTDIGHSCVMAKVDGKVVPLNYELNNGEVVEILTRKDSTPKLQWLSMVKTNFAKSRIKAWFSNLNKENNVKEGKALLNKQLERIGKPPLDSGYSILRDYLDKNLSLTQRESLIEEVGRGAKMASDIIRKIFPYEKTLVHQEEQQQIADDAQEEGSVRGDSADSDQVLIGGEAGLPFKIAACCGPVKGDNIVGYVTRGHRITIHKTTCPHLDSLSPERIVFAYWKGDEDKNVGKYSVWIKLLVFSRVGLLKEVAEVISDYGVNIVDIRVRNVKEGINEDMILLRMKNLDKFDAMMDRLQSLKGVLKVIKSRLKS